MRLARRARLWTAIGITGLFCVGWPFISELPCFLPSRTVPASVALAASRQPAPTRHLAGSTTPAVPLDPRRRTTSIAPHVALVDEYCLSCHDKDHEKGKLVLETVAEDKVA